MDRFRTEVTAPEFPFSIDHQSVVTMMGSCFAEHIGALLIQNKINTILNPFGILFNPFSIMNSLERMLNNRPYTEQDLVESSEYWVSLDHHGKFNKRNASEAIDHINAGLQEGRDQLLKTDVLFITLGTAWVYKHISTDHIVANCHKLPGTAFEKNLMSFQDVHLTLRHIPQFLASKGIDAQVVFTVSPVRHWKDGAIENQRSKAHLNSAIHAVVDEFETCHYFPSYELLMDDLRDYRFYGTDMLHPNVQAIEYVWQKFQESLFTPETMTVCQDLKAVTQAASHRPTDPESNSFQRFVKKQLEVISSLEQKYPHLDLSVEKKQFQAYQL